MKTSSINDIVGFAESKIVDKVLELSSREFRVDLKSDSSLVTELDYYISNLIKEKFIKNNQSECFYCEEDFSKLFYPAYVLDPLDGTKEFVKQYPECAVSLAYLNSSDINDSKNWAWIFNPLTGESFRNAKITTNSTKILKGLISNTENEQGLYSSSNSEISLTPIGSIAYKLALLSQGKCDFVITKRPKNIWDIAAGTLLCHKVGIHMYSGMNQVNKLDELKYESPMVWCRPGDLKAISSLF